MSNLTYEFAPTGGGEEVGWNDPSISMFKGDIYTELPREAIQNVIDAKDPKISGPAKVIFSLEDAEITSIPSHSKLLEICDACNDYCNEKQDPAGMKEMPHILELLKEDYVKVLKISDYNTTGLAKKDYDGLLKSVGLSPKGAGQGGSWGLGKGAYWVASLARTVFVSSKHADDGLIFQGKLRLTSHRFLGSVRQGNGMFGMTNQEPVRDEKFIPRAYRRAENGTDFFIVGFRHAEDWAEKMIKSVLRNFWLAILDNKLEVTVGGVEINRTNISKRMHEYFDEFERGDNPLPFFNAFTDTENHKVFAVTLPTLGKVELYFLLKDKYPNRVHYFRKTGMLIKDRGRGSMQSYAAVFICDNANGNTILRRMENPSHNIWKLEFCSEENKKEYKECKQGLIELNNFVDNSFAELNEKIASKSHEIEDLDQYLYLPENEDEEGGHHADGSEAKNKPTVDETGSEVGLTGDEASYEVSPIKTVNVRKEIVSGVATDGKKIELHQGGGKRGKKGKGAEEGDGDEKVMKLVNVDSRSFSKKNKVGETQHVVLIKDFPDKACDIHLSAGTDSDSLDVDISNAVVNGKACNVEGSVIKGLHLEAGDVEILIKFVDNEKYSLNVSTYESN